MIWLLSIGAVVAMVVLAVVVAHISEGKTMRRIDFFQKKTKVSDALAGELFQGIATSFPEMSIMLISVVFLHLNPAVGMSSSIGSGVFQFLPVIGIPALFAIKALRVDKYEVIRSVGFYVLSLVVLLLTIADGEISQLDLRLSVIVWIAYMVFTIRWRPKIRKARRGDPVIDMSEDPPVKKKRIGILLDKIFSIIPEPPKKISGRFSPVGFILSLLVIGVLVYFLLTITKWIGVQLGIPLSFLGLTVLATISSLPELATNVPLAKNGKGDQIIGNAVGSNSIDIAISFAFMTILAAWIQQQGSFTIQDQQGVFRSVVLLLIVAVLFLVLLALSKWKIGKRQARILIGAYIVYVVISYFTY